MDKISSILPSSARITSVDLKEGAALRPGVPSFGRVEGVSGRNRERGAQLGETTLHASEKQRTQMNWREKDMAQAAVAQEVTRNFFGSRNKDREQAGDSMGRVQDEIATTAGDHDGASSTARGGASAAIVGATRDFADVRNESRNDSRESKPAGFHTDEVSSALKLRNFHPEVSFDADEARTSLTDPSFFPSTRKSDESNRQQPEGLYPKGSFIDRTA